MRKNKKAMGRLVLAGVDKKTVDENTKDCGRRIVGQGSPDRKNTVLHILKLKKEQCEQRE